MDNELLTKTQREAWNNSFEISDLKKDTKKLSRNIYTLACIIHEEFTANGSSFISPDSYHWFQQSFEIAGSGNDAFEKSILNLIKKYDPTK
jgi:hypothetical protein